MNQRARLDLIAPILLVALISGCAARTERQSFPLIWPNAVTLPPRTGQAVPETGPMVLVEPVRYGEFDETDVPATISILTDLLAQRLQTKGIAARTTAAQVSSTPLRLQCAVEKLDFTHHSKYPATTTYEAHLSCSLDEPGLSRPRWTQQLAQRFERMEVVNMMTKLPSQHEKVLFNECIIPLWDAMAVSLKTFMQHAPDTSDAAVMDPSRGREQSIRDDIRELYSK